MRLDYASLRTQALATCVLPPKFDEWPSHEQSELRRLAELSLAEARREVTPPRAPTTAHRAVLGKIEALLRSIENRMQP